MTVRRAVSRLEASGNGAPDEPPGSEDRPERTVLVRQRADVQEMLSNVIGLSAEDQWTQLTVQDAFAGTRSVGSPNRRSRLRRPSPRSSGSRDTEPVHAAEGVVALLERVSPALENVDSSSGAFGSAVNRAIAELVPLIAAAPADASTRAAWLKRLFEAHGADQIPHIETLADSWGELCGSIDVGSDWSDRLITAADVWAAHPARSRQLGTQAG
jgi:hypothetical protein